MHNYVWGWPLANQLSRLWMEFTTVTGWFILLHITWPVTKDCCKGNEIWEAAFWRVSNISDITTCFFFLRRLIRLLYPNSSSFQRFRHFYTLRLWAPSRASFSLPLPILFFFFENLQWSIISLHIRKFARCIYFLLSMWTGRFTCKVRERSMELLIWNFF